MYYLIHILHILLLGYGISTLIFLLVAIFSKKCKSLKSDYLNIANLIALSLTIILSIVTIINFIENFRDAKNDEFAYIFYVRNLYITLITSGLVPLLYLLK